jgi:cupin fold WbuC family metalloprotein
MGNTKYMITKIYSKVDPNKLLHIVVKKEDLNVSREDLVPENNFIQCSRLQMDKGKTFRPHRHIWKNRTRDVIAQESWVVIEGSVKCIFYDLDNTILKECILTAGDASFTLEGGHNYEILEDNTFVYEYKTGPYEGQSLDKEFLNG